MLPPAIQQQQQQQQRFADFYDSDAPSS